LRTDAGNVGTEDYDDSRKGEVDTGGDEGRGNGETADLYQELVVLVSISAGENT